MTRSTFACGWLCVSLLACSDDGQTAQVDAATETSAQPDSLADTVTSMDVVATEVADADTAVDVEETVSETTSADADADGVDAVDIPDTAVDVALDTMLPDLVGDTTEPPDTDTSAPIAVADCPVQPMTDLYSGILPPNPFAAWPPADACVARKHDVIIVLGCPNKEDGQPDTCQIDRADIAVALLQSGYGDSFITSGAAVHTPFVEAHTLRDLLVARGVAESAIHLEPQAQHTDENIYYSSQIMAAQGWTTALVVSDSPGHLMMSAICDSNCCVDLGRLTLFEFPVTAPAGTEKVGHYVRHPSATPITQAECDTIEGGLKFMCVNLGTRLACKDDFQLPP